jgi:undecaprenyl-diphosphatase
MFEHVNAFAKATPWLHTLALDYATYGIALFAVLLVAGWWIARRAADASRMAAALSAGAAVLLAVAINQPIVNTVREARPYTTLPPILVLADRSTDFSFPSDHATMAGAAAAGLWLVSRRLGVLAAAAALLMAFTRVYIAAHYPADVLAGLLLGGAVAAALWALTRHLVPPVVTKLSRTPVRPLLAAGPQPPAQ